jgi:hypothetical protein
MRRTIREKLTYANVVSTIALFGVIAGGTAIALPGKKTVQANDMKKNSVKAAAIAANAVAGSEIADGAVTGADVADGGLSYQDLGSNSVVARIRSTGAVNTGDGGAANPVPIPLGSDSWTQAGNEIDVGFGQITFVQPPTCTAGSLRIEYLIGGQLVDTDLYNASTSPGQTLVQPAMTSRPFLFEPGAPAQRTLTARAFDTCGGAGQNFVVESLAVNVIGTR